MDAQLPYNQHFQQVLQQLNAAQRVAVEHIEGPVLVIAGPGTGKTQILAARVGCILTETDTLPQNILCLTFTDAGVHAMRRRLLELIGPDAHRVHIYTFHSFCNTIIQDNVERFGRHNIEPVSDLERVEIIRKLVDELDVAHPLKRGQSDVYFYEKHLYELFRQMKTEAWPVAYVQQQIDAYLADLPNRPEFIYQVTRGNFRKGEQKQAKMEDTTIRMERLRAAAALYPHFEQAMQQARRYDYDDMILWVLQAFEQDEALLRNYQEQYLYFLVDEYQDTNGAQNNILKKLVEYWDSPNMFIVGDDDQSIYEFQGARLKNLADFYQTYRRDVQLVLLGENYRSSQSILDAAAALIQHNRIRIVHTIGEPNLTKTLRARHPEFAHITLPPEIVVYPDRRHEDADIVAQITQMQAEGFPIEEVAIIYARHRQAQNIISLFAKKGIPYHTRRSVNILDLPLIRNIREMLEYLQAEYNRPHSGEHLLFRLFYTDFLGVLPADVAKLSRYIRAFADEQVPPLRVLLRDRGVLAKLNMAQPEAFVQLAELNEALLTGLHSSGPLVLLEKLVNRSGLLKKVLDDADHVWLLQVVKTFFDFVQEETRRHPRLSLRQLLEMLQRMDDNHLPIAVQKTTSATQGVQLLTAHSAKGLEFQRVFLLDCTTDGWEPGARGNYYRFPLPDTLVPGGEEDATEARRRLFYVAMTRAKERLQISFGEQDATGKELQRAVFVDEMVTGADLTVQARTAASEVLAEAQLLQLTSAPVLTPPEETIVNELLEGFRMNISALNRYLDCPLSFYFEHVLRAPIRMSEAAAYGTAMHQALRRLFDRMGQSGSRKFLPEGMLIQFFMEEMQQLRGNFSQQEYERRLEIGQRHLQAYYQKHLATWPRQVRVEWSVRQVEVDGVPLTGTIDRLDLHDGAGDVIVDYKTGKPDAKKLRDAAQLPPHGSPYWRQLVFYKILYESTGRHTRRATTGRISWLEPDGKGRFTDLTVELRPTDVQMLRALIRETYDRILQHEFYEGCGKPNCQWCNFVRYNTTVDSFADAATEALDD